MAKLQRPDDRETWIKCLENCQAQGLLEEAEVQGCILADGVEDYFLTSNLKQRLLTKGLTFEAFGVAYKAIWVQLVKDGMHEVDKYYNL